MKRIVGAGIGALLVMGALTACGGDDNSNSSGSYCDDISNVKDSIQGLQGDDLTQAKFDQLTADLKGIANEAPADVQDDWQTMEDAITTLNTALDKAGVSLDDLKNLGSSGAPTLDPAKLQELAAAAQSLSSSELESAQKAIQTQVKDDCNIDIGTNN